MTKQDVLLKVRDLKTNFHTYEGVLKALRGISFDLIRGKTLGIVGETGCGKSTTGLSILRLIPKPTGKIVGGEVEFEGKDLLKIREKEMREVRGGKISMIFQQPTTSLNPVFKIGNQIAEAIELHQDLNSAAIEIKIQELKKRDSLLNRIGLNYISKIFGIEKKIEKLKKLKGNPPEQSKKNKQKAALKKSIEMLNLVGIPDPDRIAKSYPHQLSGGMQQRAMIAMALSCNPLLLIADEPTTALDVTIQAQILELIKELRKNIDLSILLITHNLGIVAEMCDKVAVMYAGQILEYADTPSILTMPKHPYTVGLIKAIPKLTEKQDTLYTIKGSVPNLISPPVGCCFHPRCEYVMEVCRKNKPELIELEKEHFVSCFLFNKDVEKNV